MVGDAGLDPGALEEITGRFAEDDDYLRRAARHSLPRPQEDRDACPAPIIDVRANRNERLGRRVLRDAFLLVIDRHGLPVDLAGRVLAADDLLGRESVDRAQDLHLLVADRLALE